MFPKSEVPPKDKELDTGQGEKNEGGTAGIGSLYQRDNTDQQDLADDLPG